MTEDLAVFIDWENIYISTVSEYNSKPNVSAILEKAREYGRIVAATAYADWTEGDFRQAPPTLYSNGISPRYISARYFPGGRAQKRRTNSIDVMLAVECSDFLHNHPQVDTYVLVTGDGDFIPLVSLLRSQGKNVVVIGVSEATSYHLIESADHFVSYSSLLEEDRAARAPDRGEPKKKATDPYRELVRAVEALKKGGKTRVLGQVKQQMIVQLNSFDERNEGFKKFKDFVVEAERRGLVNTVDQDLELQVYLPDEDVPDQPESDLAAEDPRETAEAPAGNGRSDGRNGRTTKEPEPSAPADFDLLEDLTPYELKTITRSVANLRQPASFVEIFGSLRDLDERGDLELTREEISDVISAMLEANFLNRVRAKPYKQARADMTFFALNKEKEEVKTALDGG